MPKVFEWKGWAFVFYSDEGDEPPHIHARRDGRELKLWLSDFSIASNRHCTTHEVRQIVRIVRERRIELMEAWNDHFE